MTNIIVFGAGGRAGRAVVAEAAHRGHQVTAVVRDPAKHAGIAREHIRVERGDATDPEQVRRLSDGHDAAVSTVARLDVAAERFYTDVAAALIDGLGTPGPNRLIVVGIGTNLRTPDGRRAHDADGVPDDARAFSHGHLSGVRRLQDAAALDWVVLAPPPVFLDESDGAGPVVLGGESIPDPTETADSFSYPEVARAVIDEIDTPTRHRALVSIARRSR